MPEEKLQRIRSSVREWAGKKACKRKELESLLGYLQHAATVVRPGRTFVRRIIELLSSTRAKDRWIRLNADVRADLYWWLLYTEKWNGVSMMPRSEWPKIVIETDASGSWGCGARWGSWWLQWKWEGTSQDELISTKELIPIVFAVAVWGKYWKGRIVECHCDNMAVVAVVNTGSSRDKSMMQLIRSMFFLVAHFSVQIRAVHVKGASNVAADALSRNDFLRFLQVVPDAAEHPTPIPQELVSLLVREKPDWMSPRWTQLFSACCRRA